MAIPAFPAPQPHPFRQPAEVEYPESDGKPMAETDAHARYMIDVRAMLENYFAGVPDVYVSGNLLLYYEEGEPRQSVAPDVFIVRGVPKGQRRVYKLWEERRAPDWVLEVTSRSTRWEDVAFKKGLYQTLGVKEYFLYDPLGEYLDPPHQGFRLEAGVYRPIAPNAEGALVSEALGLELRLDDGRLRLYDARAGEWLLTPAEAEAARRQAEAARQEAEA
ncbi:MAG: Uma2 family endonuclease, partial [Chloroflexi bacterium]|nr:Uma2 family endonuclease [Chloroflexota bacterium]